MLIGLAGFKKSGKTTAVKLLEGVDYPFATPLKKVLRIAYGLSYEQLHNDEAKEVVDERWGKTPRQIMQEVGTELFRKQVDPDLWVKAWERGRRPLYVAGNAPHLCVSDVRFANEVEIVRRNRGIVLLIQRDTCVFDGHESEIMAHEADPALFDAVVFNNGSLAEFEQRLATTIKRFQ